MAKGELSINLDGKQIKHDPHPMYIGITLDMTLSYKAHLTKLANEIKSHINLLLQLAVSSWGENASMLQQSTLSLCYPAAEYCCPIWSRSSYTKNIDTQLNSAMRLISRTLWPTPLPWLPVLANIPLKATADKLLCKI